MKSYLAGGCALLALLACTAPLAAANPWARPIPSTGSAGAPVPQVSAPPAIRPQTRPAATQMRLISQPAPVAAEPVATQSHGYDSYTFPGGSLNFAGGCTACCGLANVGLWADYCAPRRPLFRSNCGCGASPAAGDCGCSHGGSTPMYSAPMHSAHPTPAPAEMHIEAPTPDLNEAHRPVRRAIK